MSRPDDIPEDVWQYAFAAERVWRDLPTRESVERHARAIMAERAQWTAAIRKR